ncbi:MAG: hypothetical protein V4707_05065 [Pseudomonadota bacterium]
MKMVLAAALIALGGSNLLEPRVVFETRAGSFVATLEMPESLPSENFGVIFHSPTDGDNPSEFEYVPTAGFDCYWHQFFPMICRNAGATGVAEVSDGRSVRSEQMPGGVTRTLVFGNARGSAEFADFRGERLEAFGFVDQETGATSNLWLRR